METVWCSIVDRIVVAWTIDPRFERKVKGWWIQRMYWKKNRSKGSTILIPGFKNNWNVHFYCPLEKWQKKTPWVGFEGGYTTRKGVGNRSRFSFSTHSQLLSGKFKAFPLYWLWRNSQECKKGKSGNIRGNFVHNRHQEQFYWSWCNEDHCRFWHLRYPWAAS